jgi:hypothetical protein
VLHHAARQPAGASLSTAECLVARQRWSLESARRCCSATNRWVQESGDNAALLMADDRLGGSRDAFSLVARGGVVGRLCATNWASCGLRKWAAFIALIKVPGYMTEQVGHRPPTVRAVHRDSTANHRYRPKPRGPLAPSHDSAECRLKARRAPSGKSGRFRAVFRDWGGRPVPGSQATRARSRRSAWCKVLRIRGDVL